MNYLPHRGLGNTSVCLPGASGKGESQRTKIYCNIEGRGRGAERCTEGRVGEGDEEEGEGEKACMRGRGRGAERCSGGRVGG